jgi:hypothetical protein
MRRHAFTPALLVPVHAALVALLAGATTVAASNDWARVVSLARNTDVSVLLRNDDVRSGRLVAADSSSMTVRSMGEDERIPRDAVQRVTRIYTRGSAPVVAAAVAAGIAATAAVYYGCSRSPNTCQGDFLVTGIAIPIAFGYVASRHTSTARREVVYEALPLKTTTDAPIDWETIRRALPPSLQGVR